MSKPTSWYSILDSARKFSPDERKPFTAPDLARVAGLQDTESSTASQIATAWLSKFVKWGYVRIIGKVTGESGRQTNAYVISENGRACEQKEGRGSQVARLLAAVRAYQKVRGQGGKPEATAFAQMVKVADEVEDR